MNKISKQITKKSIVQRQSSFAFWFIAALIVIWAIVQAWGEWDMLVVTVPAAAFLIGMIWLVLHRNDRRVKKQIEQQEKYLGVSFDDDMRDVLMGGILSDGVEAAAYGDWYTLISTGGVVAVNRRYITAVKNVQRRSSNGRYGGRIFVDVTFETVEQETMQFTTGDSWQAVADLCEWLGMPLRD